MTLENSNLIFNTLDNGIVLIDEDLNVLFWNRWLQRRTNIQEEEILNKNLIDFFPNLEVKRLKRKINTSLKLNIATYYNTSVNKYLLEIKLNKITNKVFDNMQQSVTITPYDVEKKIVVLYIYDNTLLYESSFNLEKKNIELEESKSEIDFLLDSAMEAMFLYENKECKYVNQKALDLFLYETPEELKSKDIIDLIEFSSKGMYFENSNLPYEIKMQRNDKSIFHALLQSKNMDFKNKNFRVITILDISELKEKDKILSEQSKMAALGEMLANIAHQWRQPLNAISTITSGLQLQRELSILNDENFNKGMDDVLNITEHLSQTISDFKNFMKEDKKKTVFSIEDIVNKTLSMIDGILQVRNIKVIINSKEDIKVENYSNELIQALMNIINNAQEAFENEEKEKLLFINISKFKNRACIDIVDNAKGIDKEIIHKIFEPYFTTKHQDQGTGLGLYMTHQLIEMSMRGSIIAKNITYEYNETQYRGACFTITLPLKTETEE